MSEATRKLKVRYSIGGHGVAARLILDLEPGSEISESDWPGVRDAIADLKLARFTDCQNDGSKITIELRLHKSYHTMVGVLGAARRICQAFGAEALGRPAPIRR